MTISVSAGAAAYADAAKKLGLGGGASSTASGSSVSGGEGGFADLLKTSLQGAVDAERASEQATMQAATGKADINSVVAAVTNAEVTLQTVVAVRDKVVAAYEQILQMPI
jgi:flagellar hook-basal body complex protein FliE